MDFLTKTMDETSRIRIEARAECWGDEDVPWPVVGGCNFFVRLDGAIAAAEIGSVMMMMMPPGSDEPAGRSARGLLRAFLEADGLILPGGLFFLEKGEPRFQPGCCCGLEDWRDWFGVAEGATDIWTGHDPFSLVELDGETVKIWGDRERRNEDPPFEISVTNLLEQLAVVERDLRDFLGRLGEWLQTVAPELEIPVLRRVAEALELDARPPIIE
ncbi:MAG: hypothetical protein JSS81_19515 [Acidobacteria bacterium]|nr:hypothetical protein [Acidobacteriota bacterium]